MKKILTLLVALTLPITALAAPTAWDYSAGTGILQPLLSQWAAQVKVHGITGTSTSFQNTLPLFNFTNATGTSATTTNLFSTKGTFTTICFSADTCETSWPSGGTPGGNDTYVQFNDSSSFGGDAGFVYNKTTDLATIVNLITTNSTSTSATTTNHYISGDLWVAPLTSALLQTGTGGLLAEYAGTSCTNQFVRSLSALGIATCASVNLTDDVTGTISAGSYGAATIDGDDINSNIAGRSLTLTSASPDTLDIDSEIYTFSVAANLIATTTDDGIATTTEDFLSVRIPIAATVTRVDCYASDTGTSTVKASYASSPLSAGTQIETSGNTCGSDVITSSTSLDNTAVSAGDWIRVWVSDASPTGSRPRIIHYTLTLTKND